MKRKVGPKDANRERQLGGARWKVGMEARTLLEIEKRALESGGGSACDTCERGDVDPAAVCLPCFVNNY